MTQSEGRLLGFHTLHHVHIIVLRKLDGHHHMNAHSFFGDQCCWKENDPVIPLSWNGCWPKNAIQRRSDLHLSNVSMISCNFWPSFQPGPSFLHNFVQNPHHQIWCLNNCSVELCGTIWCCAVSSVGSTFRTVVCEIRQIVLYKILHRLCFEFDCFTSIRCVM